eukprot:TRINITY_DN16866_c0_g1_i1.p1 TRINITY_DN16866_c0_g1~~TRINITY_DN16866_c0_g1_i1.p1  ORF type:complete len:266 (+),score=30.90 TRINITY_DN16866_c0_g1_i1:811-1608(+)
MVLSSPPHDPTERALGGPDGLGLYQHFSEVEEHYYRNGCGKSECGPDTTLRAALELIGLGDITLDAKKSWDMKNGSTSYNETTFARKVLPNLMEIMINVDVQWRPDGPLPVDFAFDTRVREVDEARDKFPKRAGVLGVEYRHGNLVVVGEETLDLGSNRAVRVNVKKYTSGGADAIKIARIVNDAARMEKWGDVTQCKRHHDLYLTTYQIFKDGGMYIDIFCRIGRPTLSSAVRRIGRSQNQSCRSYACRTFARGGRMRCELQAT